MKALRLAAILMLAGGAAMVAPQAAQAQVNQLDAEINIIPDKVTKTTNGIRISLCLVGIPGTSQRIDSVDLVVGPKVIKATDIDGVDFERHFQFEDTGVQVIELDFPYTGPLSNKNRLVFHTEKGDVSAPAKQ
ncbi:MAG: hypothetical protein ACI30D_07555 [Muribaculaceae bacterium]|nr:hypothetical protein [Muribaculaceae bacterium]